MALETLETSVDIIQNLSDYPNQVDGLSASELKAKFDEGPNIIKNYINDKLVPTIEAAIAELEEKRASLSEKHSAFEEYVERIGQTISDMFIEDRAALILKSQGRSASYYVTTPGWKRILNIIRASNGMLTLGVAKARHSSGYSVQALGLDITGNVNFPDYADDTEPIIYQRYNHEFGENNSDDKTRRARISQVRIGYPENGTEYPETDGSVNYTTNPINCYVDVYVDFEPQFDGDRVQLNVNFAGFADSHNCEAILEETDALDTGIYGETLQYKTFTVSKDATMYMPEGKIVAKEVVADNMPFQVITGTADDPVILRNLTNGIYYISGQGKFYKSASTRTLNAGLYIVRVFSAYTMAVCITSTIAHKVIYYKITDSATEDTTVLMDDVAGNTAAIEKLNESFAEMEEALASLREETEKIAKIDDVAVGADAWSSKNIVDKLCPAFTESGAVVTCEPVEGYPLEVVTDFSSDAGVSGLTLWRGGKNMIPYPYTNKSKTTNGVTFTVNEDASISIKTDDGGCTTPVAFVLVGDGIGTSAAEISSLGMVYGESYVLSVGNELVEGVAVQVYTYQEDGTAIKNLYVDSSQSTCAIKPTNKTARIYMYIRVATGTVISEPITLYPMLKKGSEATAYEPYRGEEFTVDFGDAPTEGSYDWSSGTLTTDTYVSNFSPQTISAQQGENRLFARSIVASEDEGTTYDTTVTGRADPLAIISKQQAANESILERLSALEAAVVDNT